MKILRAAAMLVLLSGPAYAQMPDVNILPQERQKTPEERERDRQLDKAYRDSLRKIPDAKAVNDPWGSVRNAETPAAPPRARPKAKSRTSDGAR